MANVVAEILAMEVAKAVGGFAPSDAVGRILRVNLVSFRGSTSRVLKVPRCPECSDRAVRSPHVLTVGPQIEQPRR